MPWSLANSVSGRPPAQARAVTIFRTRSGSRGNVFIAKQTAASRYSGIAHNKIPLYGTQDTSPIGSPFPDEYVFESKPREKASRCADTWAFSARAAGTRVVSVGIGSDIDTCKLRGWASGPGDANEYRVEFGAIDSILDNLVEDLACNADPPAPAGNCDVPLQRLGSGSNPGSANLPLDVCQGDCDDDSDCKRCLKCFQRRSGENKPVPGCSGDGGTDGFDFCYDVESQVYC